MLFRSRKRKAQPTVFPQLDSCVLESRLLLSAKNSGASAVVDSLAIEKAGSVERSDNPHYSRKKVKEPTHTVVLTVSNSSNQILNVSIDGTKTKNFAVKPQSSGKAKVKLREDNNAEVARDVILPDFDISISWLTHDLWLNKQFAFTSGGSAKSPDPALLPDLLDAESDQIDVSYNPLSEFNPFVYSLNPHHK